MQEQTDRRANYVRLAFAAYWEARKHHDRGDSMSMAVEAIRPVIEADAIAAQPQLRDAPEGFKLVPIKPTEEMLERAFMDGPKTDYEHDAYGYFEEIWDAMLAAVEATNRETYTDVQ